MFLQIISLIVFFNALSSSWSAPATPLNYNVHLFYYPWYGSQNVSKHWYHWNQNKRQPPEDIAADFYPVLGPYDSCDPTVLDKHMQWISQSGVGTILPSWWGKGDVTDKCIIQIMDAAHKHQIKVGFHIEPYGGRTAENTVKNIEYIDEKYGKHPAFFRDPALGNRGVFYIFASVRVSSWAAIEPLKKTHIILGNNYDQVIHINKTDLLRQFSGFYPYGIGADPSVVPKWKGVNDFCKAKGCVWSPGVGPGYGDNRAKHNSPAHQWPRHDGQTYDDSWKHMFDSGIPHYVSITSFNEWHEGSMIEPVSASPPKGHDYLTYAGAYKKTGKASETAYLERTAHWVEEFTKRSK